MVYKKSTLLQEEKENQTGVWATRTHKGISVIPNASLVMG